MPGYNYIMMKCGYVESNQVSWLMYGCDFFGIDGFATMEEAIKVLAEDLYSRFYDEQIAPSEDEFGGDFREFIAQDFPEFIRSLHNTTCDSYGEAEETSNRNLSWWPFWANKFPDAVKAGTVIWIGENAERVLLAALYDAKPELKLEDDDYMESRDWADFKAGQQPRII
jgi:hypothetical protein